MRQSPPRIRVGLIAPDRKLRSLPRAKEAPPETTSAVARRNVEADGQVAHRQTKVGTRRRLLNAGAASWTASDALQEVLGLMRPRRNTKAIATKLLQEFETFGGVVSASLDSLMAIDGVGRAEAELLRSVAATACWLLRNEAADGPIFETSDSLKRYLTARLRHDRTKTFFILYLDRQNRLIGDEPLWRGSADFVSVDAREVIQRCLELDAASFIIVKSDPSDNPSPSLLDINLSESLAKAAALFKIIVLDYLILGAGGMFSFCKDGLRSVITGQKELPPPPGAILH